MPLLGQLGSPRSPSTVGKTRNNSWWKETVSDVWGSHRCCVSGESFPAVVFHSILNSWRRILSANNSLKADDVRRQRFSLSVHLTVRFHCLVNMWCIPPPGGNTTRSAGILRVCGFDLDCEAVGAMRQNEAYLRCGAGAGRKRKDFNQMQWKWFFFFLSPLVSEEQIFRGLRGEKGKVQYGNSILCIQHHTAPLRHNCVCLHFLLLLFGKILKLKTESDNRTSLIWLLIKSREARAGEDIQN